MDTHRTQQWRTLNYMRTIIVFIAVSLIALMAHGAEQTASNYNAAFYGPRAIVDRNMQDMVNSWFKAAETNGVVCAVSFAPTSWKGSPIFYVNIIDTTTNFIHGFLQRRFEGCANIQLLDPKGKPVPKTDAGREVSAWTDQQIKDWFENNREKPRPYWYLGGKNIRETKGIADTLFPLLPQQVSDSISLPKLFQLKEAGEYELHIKMKVAFTRLNSVGEMELKIFWLPEVVAKVQIRPENIPPPGLSSNAQTNLPAK